MKKLLFITAALITILTGCSLLPPGVATVWTNIPEIAVYSEIYNALGEQVKINAVYKEEPALAATAAEKGAMPDLIIGTHLNSTESITLFSSLEHMFGEEGLREEDFYPGILSLGALDGQKVLLPVSFNLDGLMVNGSDRGITSSILPLEEIRELSMEYTKNYGKRDWAIGFSPAWSDRGSMLLARLLNAAFRENQVGTLIWNDEALENAVEYSRQWIIEINGGFERDQEFIQKYLYDPGRKLLTTSPPRIRFFPTTIRTFAQLPSQAREPLDIIWPQHEGKIEVLENIVFAGIVKGTKQKHRSTQFISWLLSHETQKKLLESTRFKRIRTFGIANGLSSLPKINENIFPEYYPFLVGRIPPVKYFHFPQAIPREWENMQQEVIAPWIHASLSSSELPREALPEEIRKWYLQQPDF